MGGGLITGVAAGAVSATSTDAVNGSQLYAASSNAATLGQTTANALGGGSTSTAAGGVTAPTITIVGPGGAATVYSNVSAPISALGNGGAGPIQYSTPGTPSNSLNLVGVGGPVTLGNVGAGLVSSTSIQAINGAQLYSNAGSVAANFGGGSNVNANGAVSSPSYAIQGANYNNVGSALGAVNNSLTNLQGQITSLSKEVRGGIASTAAMSSAPMPSAGGKTSWVANGSEFQGQAGFGAGFAHRFDTNEPLAATASIGFGGSNYVTARVGLMGEF